MKQKQVWVTTILLVGVVFTIGVVIGNAYRSSSSNEVSKVLQNSELDAESFLIEQTLFESFDTNCDLAQKRLDSLSAELWSLGKVLGGADAKGDLGAQDYDFLKRKYHLMQIRTYVLEKKLSTDCGIPVNVILYYFSQGDSLSAQQGRILDELVAQNKGLHVFAIEYDYSKELKFLEEYYQINVTPSLVVNFDRVFPGLVTKANLEPLVHAKE